MSPIAAESGPAHPTLRGASIALGVMDGVHLGHQAVVADARAAAQRLGAPAAAAVFEPHPRHYFDPSAPPFRLQSPGQRSRALAGLGLDGVIELSFGSALAALTKDEFVAAELVGRLGIRHVSVGADFRFGKGRAGDVADLKAAGDTHGFSVGILPEVLKNGERVSSTLIRGHVAAGRMQEAAALLTRPWSLEGVVATGDQRGRTLGFATANTELGDYIRPRFGIYAVRVDVGDGALRPGVASCGVRPMWKTDQPMLETHLFDFAGDLYGKRIEVQMIGFLRGEQVFGDIDALVAQMRRDAEAAKTLLSRPG
ncbi:MAG: bifunctional riboflavin kinase/FAD synthetase [Hyphomonadaceae bacterium]|nr:bifunctional riboflavin kinase/FAD synthetase [Hyphomonadaceae bacterium]